MTTTVVNPTTVTIGDANITAQAVTSFKVLAGTTTGGPYTTLTGTVPNSSFTDSATGATGPFADIVWATAPTPFTIYFAVCQALNAQGASANSLQEVSFQIAGVPTAPTNFSLA